MPYQMPSLLANTTTTARSAADYQHEIDIGKFVSIPVIFLIVLIACLLPQVLVRFHKRANLLIQFLTCLSGGALLSIGLLHIIPHAREGFELYEEAKGGADPHAGHDHFVLLQEHYITSLPLLKHKIPTHTYHVDDVVVSPQEQYEEYVLLEQNVPNDVVNNIAIASTPPSLPNQQQQQKQPPHRKMTTPTSSPRFSPLQETAAAEDSHDHNHGFPWTELTCGLVILLLICVEQALHKYLATRGSGVSLHSHGGDACHGHGSAAQPGACGSSGLNRNATIGISIDDAHGHHHAHNHNHHHDHGHDHPHAADECIELQPAQTTTTTSPTSPVTTSTTAAAAATTTTPPYGDDEANVDDDEDEVGLSPTESALRAKKKAVDAYISCFAISLHCIFNGMALGAMTAATQNGASQFWTFFGATVGHKVCDALAVAIPLARSKLDRLAAAIIIIGVSFATPIGVIIGYFATTDSAESYLAQAILLALSSGSFFYIAMLEMIPHGTKGRFFILKWLAVGVGFAIPAIIAQYA